MAGAILAASALVALVPAEQAAAAPSCVKYASTTGSDSAAGTQTAPYKTAQKLVDSLSAGQAGCLQPGQTFGSVTVSRGGITLTTAPGGAKATLLGKLWIKDSANDVTIENLVLDGSGTTARVSFDTQGDRVVFRGNDITNRNTAICLHVGSNAGYGVAYDTVIDSNRIFNCGRLPATNFDHGIYVNHAYDTRITNNLIYDNADYGVHLYPGANRTYVANNVIDGNGRGLTFSSEGSLTSSDNVVENNIISNSGVTTNVESWWGGAVGVNNRADRNCLWNGRKGNFSLSNGGFTLSANVEKDPLFVNRSAKDFSLRADSPCLGKGPQGAEVPVPPPPPSLPPANVAPTAAFSASTLAPQTGQTVTFTDGSSDPDGTIAAREWDLDGDGAYEATGQSVSRAYAAAGTVTVRLRVTDDDGATATASRTLTVSAPPVVTPPPPAGEQAVANGSFESGTTGWTTWQAGLSRVALADAPEGSYVARVARTTGTSFTIDDEPTTIGSATKGAEYTGRAYVKAAATASVGKQVKIYMRERSASGAVLRTVAGPAVTLGNGFIPVTASLTASASGNQIELYVAHTGAVTGSAFYMDAVRLGAGAGTTPPPPPSLPPANVAPTAAFSASTLVPQTGQTVTFTDGSSDPDGTIAAREWDLDGDGAYEATGQSVSRAYAAAGTVTVRLRVTDDDGATATASRTLTVSAPPVVTPPPPAGEQAVANGSFESGTTGWTTWQAGLSRVALADAPEGSYVARVARTTGTSFTIDDEPTTIGSATKGAEYTGRAYVKAAATASVGKQVKIYMRERSASGAVLRTVAGPAVTLGNGFIPVTASLTASASGNQIELYVAHTGAVTGSAFYIDAVTLTR
ncbi:PKD domain-containing protein [Miltoncostaea marina]|uniref:PKD domain-containing protein n=1 Tax=Miltoncostaea marina TaxID=2843215 RepID=UPI001C3D7716|nr:PKD domain-containing protein [Miltoncostaea marina]